MLFLECEITSSKIAHFLFTVHQLYLVQLIKYTYLTKWFVNVCLVCSE